MNNEQKNVIDDIQQRLSAAIETLDATFTQLCKGYAQDWRDLNTLWLACDCVTAKTLADAMGMSFEYIQSANVFEFTTNECLGMVSYTVDDIMNDNDMLLDILHNARIYLGYDD